jgi:hypothetical protein
MYRGVEILDLGTRSRRMVGYTLPSARLSENTAAIIRTGVLMSPRVGLDAVNRKIYPPQIPTLVPRYSSP